MLLICLLICLRPEFTAKHRANKKLQALFAMEFCIFVCIPLDTPKSTTRVAAFSYIHRGARLYNERVPKSDRLRTLSVSARVNADKREPPAGAKGHSVCEHAALCMMCCVDRRNAHLFPQQLGVLRARYMRSSQNKELNFK
jgi:hypothetical protein